MGSKTTKFLGATDDANVMADVDALLYAGHRTGGLTADQQVQLRSLMSLVGLEEAALPKRLEALLGRKREAAEAKAKRERPAFGDEGVILVVPEVRDLFLTMTRTEVRDALVVDEVLADSAPLPDLSRVRLHRHPDDEPEQFDYLCKLLRDVHEKRIKPGTCAVLVGQGERYPLGRLQRIDPSNPPIGMDERALTFVKLPHQSAAAFQAAKDALAATLRARGVAIEMPMRRAATPTPSGFQKW